MSGFLVTMEVAGTAVVVDHTAAVGAGTPVAPAVAAVLVAAPIAALAVVMAMLAVEQEQEQVTVVLVAVAVAVAVAAQSRRMKRPACKQPPRRLPRRACAHKA